MFIDIAYAAEATKEIAVQATEHTTEASEGLLASLGINGTLFIFQLINFTIVALIIWFLILKPLTKKMTERQDKITSSLIKAEEVDANLRHSEQKYQEKIDEAKGEAANIISRAATEAVEAGERIKVKSKAEIESLVAQAKKNIQIEKEEMLVEIKQQAGEMVVIALEKILEEKITNAKDKEMILRSVKNIKV
jgi:F-type H+-transporting ATPase subunit b